MAKLETYGVSSYVADHIARLAVSSKDIATIQPTYDTVAAVQAATVPSVVSALSTAGYTAAGDGGAAIYKRVSAGPAIANFRFQSADGAWWENADKVFTASMGGVVGDGSTDNLTAWSNVLAQKQSGELVQFGDGTYTISSNAPGYGHTPYVVALPGASFTDDTTANKFFRNGLAPQYGVSGTASFELYGENTGSNRSMKFMNYRILPTASASSYQKTALFIAAVTQDPSSASDYDGITPAVSRDVVGIDSRGIIAAGNSYGRAWGANFWGRIDPTGDGQVNGIEVAISNNGTAVKPATGSGNYWKTGVKIVALGGTGTAAISIEHQAGTWYAALYCKQNDLTNDVDSSFLELNGWWRVDRNGVMYLGSAKCLVQTGTGTPEGVVTAPVGSLFLRTDGGATTTLYVKTSGTGNTGWTAK